MSETYLRTEATGTVNDKSFGPLTDYAGLPTVLEAANATTLTITGLTAGNGNKPFHGQQLWIMSTGAGAVALANQDSGSQAQNRIITGTSATLSLPAFTGRVLLLYDNSAERWRVLSSTASFTTPTFDGANFTGNGSMTWTVDAGDVSTYAYAVQGKLLYLAFWLASTTVGGTPNTTLQIKVPGGLTVAKNMWATFLYNDNGGTTTVGEILAPAGSTTLFLAKFGSPNWTASTNNTTVKGEIFFEVQ